MTVLNDATHRPVLGLVARSPRTAPAGLALQEVSRFFGMVISLRYDEQMPPHFHVRYGEHRAIVALDTMRLIDGFLSPRVLGFICEWSAVHRSELIRNWWRSMEGRSLLAIEPLD
jgi:hypothetical protein